MVQSRYDYIKDIAAIYQYGHKYARKRYPKNMLGEKATTKIVE